MSTIDNNQFEVKSAKRKVQTGPNVYLNPALDLLANEDPMVNTAMEITPHKRRKRTKSCDIATFENSALDLGISKSAVNEFLQRELQNVQKNIKKYDTPVETVEKEEPIYANLSELSNIQNNLTDTVIMPQQNINETNLEMADSALEVDSGISVLDNKSTLNTETFNGDLHNNDVSAINNTTNIQTNVNNQIFINNSSNLNLSFIDRLALDSPNTSNQSLYFDDDLNESNIMEIKTITIITKKKIIGSKKNTNPFLDPNLKVNEVNVGENPFLDQDETKTDSEYTTGSNLALNNPSNIIVPRQLFTNDTNSTISTVNESLYPENHLYENVDSYRSESPIYENIGDIPDNYNKQSKILGYDVSQFSAIDIMNLNRKTQVHSNDLIDKKDLKHHLLKASNKLSKKVFKTLKKKFKSEKVDHNVTINPYEVPRKAPKQKEKEKESGIANPALNLDNSDEIEIEELDDEHEYESIKTIRNTRLNTNVTPLKEKFHDNFDHSHNSYTAGKKVRFDSTLNKEKIITGNSFDGDIQSPGFNAKIDKYHDELENCINERKYLQQNM